MEVELKKAEATDPFAGVADLELVVRDFCRGIPTVDQSTVFEPVFATGHDRGDAGLGLSIVPTQIVDSLDGDIILTS